MKKSQFFCLGVVILISFIYENNSNASFIKITNNSGNSIEIKVIPEPLSEELPYCWKCLDSCLNPSGINSKTIIVPIESLKKREEFAINGTQGGFLFNGTCRNLSVYKNYEITFIENIFGISCVSREN